MKQEWNPGLHCASCWFWKVSILKERRKSSIPLLKESNAFQKGEEQGTRAIFLFLSIHRLRDIKARRTVQGHFPIHVLSVFFFHIRSLSPCFTLQSAALSRPSSRWLLMRTPRPWAPHCLQHVKAVQNFCVLKASSQSSQNQGVGWKDLQDHAFPMTYIALPGHGFM